MATISLTLPEDIKQRAAAAAQQRGISLRAFMVDAIVQTTTAAEGRSDFASDARAARDQMVRTGMGYDVGEVTAYLKARIAGTNPAKPKARPWRS